VHRRQGRDWGLVEEARRLKQGAHTYRTRTVGRRLSHAVTGGESDLVGEQLKKEQTSD
jgi:hypothetical protein